MKKKKSFKVMWNVFLFVICGGSLIYGFVQHRRMVESKVQTEKYQQQMDSLERGIEITNTQLKIALEQLQIEKNSLESALKEAKRQEQQSRK